jgi:hypothetical protein
MQRIALLTLIGVLLLSSTALAVPETVSVRITDVTPSSFAVVWMTDVAAEPTVQVFADSAASNEITGAVRITALPDAAGEVAAAARAKGIMKVRVSGLAAGTTYYVRTVTVDPGNASSVGYSAPQAVTLASTVAPYRTDQEGSLQPSANDLASFPVYIRPADTSELPGLGDLLLLETEGSSSPVSAFVGQGIAAPEGLLDLNNLFDLDGLGLHLASAEKATLRIYRGGTLTTLLHFRTIPAGSDLVNVTQPVHGFFADLNLDGKVDAADFALFKEQYQQVADGGVFNPDYNFIPVQADGVVGADVIDARDFARFATQFGREDVE